jgi:hypothetical protein
MACLSAWLFVKVTVFSVFTLTGEHISPQRYSRINKLKGLLIRVKTKGMALGQLLRSMGRYVI